MHEKTVQKRIAQERIDTLFEQASQRPNFAKRYVTLARKIALRYKIRIPKNQKKKYCAKCNTYFIIGKNCTTRIREKYITIKCTECNNNTRIPK